VASVLWAIVGGLYQNNEEIKSAADFYQFSYRVCEERKTATFDPAKNQDCSAHAWEFSKPFRDSRLGDVLLVAFAPIALGWLLIFLCMHVMRWVRAGFNPTS
jgi:hypothetical protein